MNNTAHSNKFKKLLLQKEYWGKEFTGEIPILDILTDYVRPQKVYA